MQYITTASDDPALTSSLWLLLSWSHDALLNERAEPLWGMFLGNDLSWSSQANYTEHKMVIWNELHLLKETNDINSHNNIFFASIMAKRTLLFYNTIGPRHLIWF